MNKYHAVREGGFHSKLEKAVYDLILLREKAGEIELIKTQDNVYLSEARVLYIADFKCFDLKTGETFHIEAKGFEGPRWPTIKKLWKIYGPGKLEIWKGTHVRPVLVQTIMGKGKI